MRNNVYDASIAFLGRAMVHKIKQVSDKMLSETRYDEALELATKGTDELHNFDPNFYRHITDIRELKQTPNIVIVEIKQGDKYLLCSAIVNGVAEIGGYLQYHMATPIGIGIGKITNQYWSDEFMLLDDNHKGGSILQLSKSASTITLKAMYQRAAMDETYCKEFNPWLHKLLYLKG